MAKATAKSKSKKRNVKKKTNIGLAAKRFSPLNFKLGLKKGQRLNRGRLVGLVLILILIGVGIKLFASASSGPGTAYLKRGDCIHRGDALKTSSKKFAAKFQSDSNFVIYYLPATPDKDTWSTDTRGTGGTALCLGNDGNLVMLKPGPTYPIAVWQTHTANKGVTHLMLKDDSFGNLVLYKSDNTPVWSARFGQFGCVNPFAGTNYALDRIDQGVDYNPAGGRQPIKTPCRGTVLGTAGGGWPGGVYIHFKIDPKVHSPVAGKCIYFAEAIQNVPKIGSVFKAGEKIADTNPTGDPIGHQEWGWSYSQGRPAISKIYDPGRDYHLNGEAWDHFMQSLGGYNHGHGTKPLYPANTHACA